MEDETMRENRIAEIVTFLTENEGEDRPLLIELLKDDGYTGSEIMDGLAASAAEKAA
jgi:hypothetical protein